MTAAALVLLLAASCGGDDESAEPRGTPEPTVVVTPESVVEADETGADDAGTDLDADVEPGQPEDGAEDSDEPSPGTERALEFGEAFIDAFYGFERRTVQLAVIEASETSQGLANYAVWWAEAMGAELVERFPCEARGGGLSVTCDVRVRDALSELLGLDEATVVRWFIALDGAGTIEEVRLVPDDPPQLDAGYAWVIANRPGLFDDGDCAGFFAGGPTPVECAAALQDAFADYAATLG